MEPALSNPTIRNTQLFINNEWVNSVSGKTFATFNPSTGEKICDIQEADKADVEKAIKAARDAFELGSEWRRMDASQRSRLLYKLADLVEKNRQYLATLETLDNGKPYKTSYFLDVPSSVKTCRYFAGWADKITGQTIPVDGEFFSYTRVEPVGVVGAVIPWNYPICMFLQKLAPALTCGCTIVIKPAEQTPLTALAVAALVKEVGFPPGVVNVVPGFGPTAGAPLVESMDVDKVTFTGSTAVGKRIMKTAADTNLKRVTLELGGKSPNIVFPDADLDNAVLFAGPIGVFSNSGQICCALTRTYVHEDIYEEFVKKAAEQALKRREHVGDPFDMKTENGPQISERQLNNIQALVDSGVKEGARLVVGGKKLGDKGYFFEPTVFADVTEDMRIGKEEIFGPVQSIFKFKTMEEAIKKANETSYGLAASIFTKDIDKAMTFSNSVKAGSVWVNNVLGITAQAPFGGYKMSGIGRELGSYGLEPYCEIKTVTVKLASKC